MDYSRIQQKITLNQNSTKNISKFTQNLNFKFLVILNISLIQKAKIKNLLIRNLCI